MLLDFAAVLDAHVEEKVTGRVYVNPFAYRSAVTRGSTASSSSRTYSPVTTFFERTSPMTPPNTDIDSLRDRVQRLGVSGVRSGAFSSMTKLSARLGAPGRRGLSRQAFFVLTPAASHSQSTTLNSSTVRPPASST